MRGRLYLTMTILRITTPSGEQTGYPMPADIGGGYRIGRDDESCDIALPEDSALSRLHCSVRVTENGIELTDEHSSNGVWQGERRVSSEVMSAGTVYSIGQCKLELVAEEEAAPAPEPEVKAPLYIDLAAQGAAAETAEAAHAEEKPAEEHPKKKHLHTAAGEGGVAPRPTLVNHAGKGIPAWLWLLLLALLAGLGYYLYTLMTEEPGEAPAPTKAEKIEQLKRDVVVDDWQTEDEPAETTAKDDSPAPAEEPQPELEEEEEEPIPDEPIVIQKSSTGQEWKQPKSLKIRLESAIRSRLKRVDDGTVDTFLHDPANELMLAQWEVLNRADLDKLSKLMRDPAACKRLSPLLNNSEWCASFVYDGEMSKADVALGMVNEFLVAEEKRKDKPAELTPAQEKMKKRMAAAIAVEFARNGWYGEGEELSEEEKEKYESIGMPQPEKKKGARRQEKEGVYMLAKERYLFFAESIEQDLLNSSFWGQPDWLLHFVGGWKGMNGFGSATTMRWARDNCSVPDHQYAGLAGAVPYLPLNEFGDVIFGDAYYAPYREIYPNNMAKMTRDIGAVCGGLSHFGTTGACANGVPAVTMGEPGHCAYTVYLNGEWQLCNSVNSKHFPHWGFCGEHTWSAFQMMTAMYKEPEKTRLSQEIGSLAGVMTARRNLKDAVKLYERALGVQPLNLPIWRNYLSMVADKMKRNPNTWLSLNKKICEALAPNYPARAGDYLMEAVYPSLIPLLRAPLQRLNAYRPFFENIGELDDLGWKIDEMLDIHFLSLNKATNFKQQYLRLVRDTAMQKPSYHQMLVWAMCTSAKDNKALSGRFFAETEQKRMEAKDPDMMLAAMIQAAEQLRDKALFDKYSAMVKDQESPKLPFIDEFHGKLASEGCLLHLTTYSDDEKHILQHAAALTAKGGRIETASSKTEAVTLDLGKRVNIGGIIFCPGAPTGSLLETSLDGENWEPLMDMPDASAKGFNRLEFTRTVAARYVRISTTSQGGNASLKFNLFNVYERTH